MKYHTDFAVMQVLLESHKYSVPEEFIDACMTEDVVWEDIINFLYLL